MIRKSGDRFSERSTLRSLTLRPFAGAIGKQRQRPHQALAPVGVLNADHLDGEHRAFIADEGLPPGDEAQSFALWFAAEGAGWGGHRVILFCHGWATIAQEWIWVLVSAGTLRRRLDPAVSFAMVKFVAWHHEGRKDICGITLRH